VVKENNWIDVRKELSDCSHRDLLGLIADLYDLSKDNKNFLETRFMPKDTSLNTYKKHIQRYLAPKEPWKDSENISIREAKKAISDYKKASSNPILLIDLMVYYVECGTNFSDEFGDMDEPYYSTLESMFDNAVKLMKKQDKADVIEFVERLEKVVGIARPFWVHFCYSLLLCTFF